MYSINLSIINSLLEEVLDLEILPRTAYIIVL